MQIALVSLFGGRQYSFPLRDWTTSVLRSAASPSPSSPHAARARGTSSSTMGSSFFISHLQGDRMTILHSTTTRARAILFTILLIGVVVAPGQAAAKLGKGAEISVGTTAVQLRDTSVAQVAKRQVLACVPEAAAGPVYVGGLGVTT